ncbi:hypothetical protein [Nocardia sp. NPDC003963]
MKFRTVMSTVSWALVVWGCLSTAGMGAAAAAAPGQVTAEESKAVVTEAITAQSLPLRTDMSDLAVDQISVEASSNGLQLVRVPVEYSAGSGGTVHFVVDDTEQIVGYAEKLVTDRADGTRAVALWQDGVQRQNTVVRPIAGDPFTDCLEAEGNQGKFAKWALQKCYSGTLISPVQGTACLLGIGVSQDIIDRCQQLAMA